MDFATKFALNLKQYFDLIPTDVWSKFERDLVPGRTWDEDCILRTSIILNGLDKQDYLQEANKNPVYKLKVTSEDYGGTGNETITGADLAIIFRFEANKKVVAQRLVLVQLKRAFFDGKVTTFNNLHHKSGKKYYGQDVHQAQKMLFFSTTPVYWFATNSKILEDKSSMNIYLQESNLLSSSKNILRTMINSDDNQVNYLGIPNFIHSFILSKVDTMSEDELIKSLEDLCYYPFYRFLSDNKDVLNINVFKHYISQVKANLPYQSLQLLKSRLESIAFDNYGLSQRIGLFVCSAEDIYNLPHEKSNKFSDLYPHSIPFSQFILHNILSREFGDPNTELINAIIKTDKSYFQKRVQEIADQQIADQRDSDVPEDIEQLVPVNRSIMMTLSIDSTIENEPIMQE